MNILVNSIPKSGTNLLQKLLDLSEVRYSGKSIAASSLYGKFRYIRRCLRQPGINEIPVVIGLDVPVSASPRWLKGYLSRARGYVTGHAQYSDHLSHILASENYKVVQIFRHPAATLVSWAHYIVRPGYYWEAIRKKMERLSFQERIRLMVKGGVLDDIIYPDMEEILLRANGWFKDKNTLVVRFEDLVGSKGGGNDEIQRNTIRTILAFSGIKKQDHEIDNIQSSLFGGTHTFREGQIDAWQKQVDNETFNLLKNTLGETNFVRQLKYFFD